METGHYPKAALLFLGCHSLVFASLSFQINNCLNLPFGSQGESWRLETRISRQRGFPVQELHRVLLSPIWSIRTFTLTRFVLMYCSYLAWGTPWTEEPGKLSPWGHKIRTWLSKETTTTTERSVIDLGNRLMKRDFLSLSFSSPALTQFLSSLHFASSPSSLFCLLIFFPKLLPWETSKVLSFFFGLTNSSSLLFLER